MGERVRFLSWVAMGLFWWIGTLGPVPAVSGSSLGGEVPKILAFGDSLTAGAGVALDQAYPAYLQKRLDGDGYRYRVVNAGVSGETTAGGLRRVAWILKSRPAVVIVELGANDGLRGLSLTQTQQNLESIIQRFSEAQVQVILAGMKLPPNYGKDYTDKFEALFPALAKKYRLPLIPFFLAGVAADPALNQADGIHPTAEGHRRVADTVYHTLRPLLPKPADSATPHLP